MTVPRILHLPGWHNSGSDHWQSRWESLHGDVRVEQHDWARPLRGDWMAQLEESVLVSETPVVLVAHSMGCLLVAAWAAHSQNAHKVQAALLVAPGDLERTALRDQLPSWQPIVRQPLTFPALLLGSQNDPYCDLERARGFAFDWQARFVDYGPRGHLNAESGLGDWPEGRQMLADLLNKPD